MRKKLLLIGAVLISIISYLIPLFNFRVYANERILTIVEIDYEDAQRLMKIAQAEAGNQGIDGMSAVMRVVLNRVESKDFPNTIKSVIEQPHQFQSYSNGSYSRAQPSTECHLALANVERGLSEDSDIIAFEVTDNGGSLERYFNFIYRIKNHNFYVEKGD